MAQWLGDKGTDLIAEAQRLPGLCWPPLSESTSPWPVGFGGDANEPTVLREKIGQALAEVNSLEARVVLVEAMRTAPERLQAKLALALAGNAEGAESLLQLTEAGKSSPRLLLARAIKERLAAAKPANYTERVEKMTKGLPPANEQAQKVIDQRRVGFNAAPIPPWAQKSSPRAVPFAIPWTTRAERSGRILMAWATAAWNACSRMCWTRAGMSIPPFVTAPSR